MTSHHAYAVRPVDRRPSMLLSSWRRLGSTVALAALALGAHAAPVEARPGDAEPPASSPPVTAFATVSANAGTRSPLSASLPFRSHNAVIGASYAGQVIRGALFTGQTTILGTALGVVFEDCTFDAQWSALYAVRVSPSDRPLARFVDCELRNAINKGAVVQWCSFENCLIENCGSDGIFAEKEGFLRIEGCTIRNLGLRQDGTCSGLHADGIQIATGSNFLIRGCTIEVLNGCGVPGIERAGNACIFVETDWTAIRSVVIAGNDLRGGIYTIWLRDDKHGPPSDVRVSSNFIRSYTNGPLFYSATVGPASGISWQNNVVGPDLWGN